MTTKQIKTWIEILSYSEMQYLVIDTNSTLSEEQSNALNIELDRRK